jgi:hypothetical protein
LLPHDPLMSTQPDLSAVSRAPNDEGATEAPTTQPPPAGQAPGRPRSWLRRHWWVVLIVAGCAIGVFAQAGLHARQALQRQAALHLAEMVPGTEGPFDWGAMYWDRNGAHQYWVKITVQAPVADTTAASGGSSLHCDITVENASESDITVRADDFLLWESLEDGPLHPVEGPLETRLLAHQSATFTLHFVTTDPTTIGSVTCGGPFGSSANGMVWHQSYLQWGTLPVVPATSSGEPTAGGYSNWAVFMFAYFAA